MYYTPPHSFEAEEAVIGIILSDNKIIHDIKFLKSEHFFSVENKIFYHSICEIIKSNKRADKITLRHYLKDSGSFDSCGGAESISKITEKNTPPAGIVTYANMVIETYYDRKIMSGYESIINSYVNHGERLDLSFIHELFKEKESGSLCAQGDSKDIIESDYQEDSSIMQEGVKPCDRISLGYSGIDKLYSGFSKKDFVVLAAPTGGGKTTFALNILNNIFNRNEDYVIALFEGEMTSADLQLNLACINAGVEPSIIKSQEKAREIREKGQKSLDFITDLRKNKKLMIKADGGLTVSLIRKHCQDLRRANKGKLDLIIIDYIGLIHDEERGKSTTERVNNVCKALKRLNNELSTPILCLSQLNRMRDRKELTLFDLKDSSALEQDADLVMFIDYDHEHALGSMQPVKISIKKNRSGSEGIVKMNFHKNKLTFEEESDTSQKSLRSIYSYRR